MHLAKKSRLLGSMDADQSRRWAAGRIAFLFQKSQGRCEEIFKAMIARGFENRVTLHSFQRLKGRDIAAAMAALVIWGCFLVW